MSERAWGEQRSAVGGQMRALSLWQPWASAIAQGLKQYETRGWATQYRGPLAIHAAKKVDARAAHSLGRMYPALRGDLPSGMMVAIVELVDCVPVQQVRGRLSQTERALGNYSDGRWAWQVRLIERLNPPIRAAGQQGLFVWTRPGSPAPTVARPAPVEVQRLPAPASRYAMLPTHHALRAEYESRPPVAWKHALLPGQIAEIEAQIAALMADAHAAGRATQHVAVRLSVAQRAVVLDPATHKKRVAELAGELAAARARMTGPQSEARRLGAWVAALRERYREGQEVGL